MIVLNPLKKRKTNPRMGGMVSHKKRTPRPTRKKRTVRRGYGSPAVGVKVRTRRAPKKRGGGFSRLHRSPSGKFSIFPLDRSVLARSCSAKKRRGGWSMHRSKAGKFSHTGRLAGCFKNPSASIIKSVSAGYQPDSLMHALPVAVGMLLNQKATDIIGARTGWDSGFKGAAVGIGSAGLSLLVPKYGPRLFMGGLARVMVGALLPYVEKWFGDEAPPAAVAPAGPVSAASAAPAAGALSSMRESSKGSGSVNPEDAPEYDGSMATGNQWNEGLNDLPIMDGDEVE